MRRRHLPQDDCMGARALAASSICENRRSSAGADPHRRALRAVARPTQWRACSPLQGTRRLAGGCSSTIGPGAEP